MRIYKTTKTERFTRNQGANDHMHTSIKVGKALTSREVVAVSVEYNTYNNTYTMIIRPRGGKDIVHMYKEDSMGIIV